MPPHTPDEHPRNPDIPGRISLGGMNSVPFVRSANANMSNCALHDAGRAKNVLTLFARQYVSDQTDHKAIITQSWQNS